MNSHSNVDICSIKIDKNQKIEIIPQKHEPVRINFTFNKQDSNNLSYNSSEDDLDEVPKVKR